MVLGIDHTKKVVLSIGALVVQGVGIAKNGVGLTTLPKLLSILQSVKSLSSEAQAALPELKDVDANEASELVSVVYGVVKDVLVAVAA